MEMCMWLTKQKNNNKETYRSLCNTMKYCHGNKNEWNVRRSRRRINKRIFLCYVKHTSMMSTSPDTGEGGGGIGNMSESISSCSAFRFLVKLLLVELWPCCNVCCARYIGSNSTSCATKPSFGLIQYLRFFTSTYASLKQELLAYK